MSACLADQAPIIMNFNQALDILAQNRPLPRDTARTRMMPEYRRDAAPVPAGEAWKDAAVLMLLYPDGEQARFPLTLRPSGLGAHSGQISLPGGSREGGETPEACALRETFEELGVEASDIRLIRRLSPLPIPPSSFLVQPCVGVMEHRPDFRPAPCEVAEVLETSLDELMDAKNCGEDFAEYDGRSWRVPYYRLAGRKVWGATAMILAELEALLRGA